MAKKYNNDKDFLIIEMNYIEAINCNFGIKLSLNEHLIICDTCNNEINKEDNIYYVAVLNKVLCSDCCEDFIKGYDKCSEDEIYEKKHYDYYVNKLNMTNDE